MYTIAHRLENKFAYKEPTTTGFKFRAPDKYEDLHLMLFSTAAETWDFIFETGLPAEMVIPQLVVAFNKAHFDSETQMMTIYKIPYIVLAIEDQILKCTPFYEQEGEKVFRIDEVITNFLI